MAKKPAKKKALKKATTKKPAKNTAKKTAKKAPAAPKPFTTDSNGDPIGGSVLSQTAAPEKTTSPVEIDTSKGAVSVKAKKTAAETTTGNKSKSVVMRGGKPTVVEDDGDDAL